MLTISSVGELQTEMLERSLPDGRGFETADERGLISVCNPGKLLGREVGFASRKDVGISETGVL